MRMDGRSQRRRIRSLRGIVASMVPDPDDNQNPPLPEFWGLWTEAIGGNLCGAEIIPTS